jgi:hypothetical protein
MASTASLSCIPPRRSSKREWLVFQQNDMQRFKSSLVPNIVMRRFFATFGLLFSTVLFSTMPARADDVRTVFELFTSQGCSSCPPADRLAGELSRDDGVLLLSFPVDYWDYLGWKDTLAHSAFSKRQKLYARTRRDRQVYTPQMVINGMSHVVGSDREAITAAEIASGALPVRLTLQQQGNGYVVLVPAGSVERPAALLLFPVQKAREVEIGRGENSGTMVTYTNVVRGVTQLANWNGAAMEVPVPSDALKGEAGDADRFVVMLQSLDDRHLGPVLGAVRSPAF